MRSMCTKALAVSAAAAVAAGAGILWSPWWTQPAQSAPAAARRAAGHELRPAGFTTRIDNPYFPLPVGRQLVYVGVKDGQTQVDVVTVTRRTKLVAAGIRARVVTDVATHGRRVLERTSDWYAQDRQGNVWYVGERTASYDADGTVDTSGSWEAGVDGAEPGIVMEAHPRIPDAYRQEYLPGEAEDTAWVVRTGGFVRVPYGTLHHVLTTLEATRIEPGLYDKKIYALGIGIVLERALTGPRETARLVEVRN
ncbi:MAG: hypothetical protein ACJ74O_20775 [Frankiaceae bacterium]